MYGERDKTKSGPKTKKCGGKRAHVSVRACGSTDADAPEIEGQEWAGRLALHSALLMFLSKTWSHPGIEVRQKAKHYGEGNSIPRVEKN